MNKMKRLLALVICLLMTITSFAFVNTSVDAAWNYVENCWEKKAAELEASDEKNS